MILKYKGFSLIEIIFSIMIISILASIAIPKLWNTSLKTTLLKARSDMIVIQNGLNQYKTKNILKNITTPLSSLDDDENLFFKILKKPFVQNKNNVNSWSKESNNIYHFWINKNESIKFIYDKNNNTFICNKTNENCQKILN